MWKTVLLLLFTLLVVPVVGFYFDVPLTELQQSALWNIVYVYLVMAGLCFIVSSVTKNYSQVDKLWSIMPIVYGWMMAYTGDFEPRLVLMASLITLWGVRLTLNFARRGGYSLKFWTGEEDYRWAALRAKPEFHAPWKWTLFNLFFISFYQMGLILLITLPMLKSLNGLPLGLWDYVLAAGIIGLLVMETVADQQQWNYQKEKYRRKKFDEPLTGKYALGFTHHGLWSHMRHPNYAAEQGIWILIYGFSITATGNWINWSIVGCLLLILLFKGSSDFSESISASKYAAYAEYQKSVPRFIPWPFGKNNWPIASESNPELKK